MPVPRRIRRAADPSVSRPGGLSRHDTSRGDSMKLRLFQIDAFASQVFGGNPAAVVPLERWLDDHTLQSIAAENNLSETAFFVGEKGYFQIRWMTPTEEVDLCGHATLAAAWVVFNEIEKGRTEVHFRSQSGPLRVSALGDTLSLDFPSRPPEARDGATARPDPRPRRAPSRSPRLARLPGGVRDRGRGAGPQAGHGEGGRPRPHGGHRDGSRGATATSSRASSCRPWAFPRTPSPARRTARSCPTGRSGSGRRGSSPARSRLAAGSCGARTGASGFRSPAAA